MTSPAPTLFRPDLGRVAVKICGITNGSQAEAIAKAGAVVLRAEQDLARSDGKNLLDTIESLDRTLGMFKNVMHKKSEAAHR